MKIKLYRANNETYGKEEVEEFIVRINLLISKCESIDIDVEDLKSFKKLIEFSKSFSPKDLWYIQELEEKISSTEEDLPF